MRKGILICTLIIISLSLIWGQACTVRMMTGVGTWYVYRFNPSGSRTAAIVSTGNIWDAVMGDPNPWSKLYPDGARWISWINTGYDSYSAPRSYVYTSPNFVLFNSISRATIWYASDDEVTHILIRRSLTGAIIADISGASGFLNLHRVDITEILRNAMVTYGSGPYYLQFYMNNTSWNYTGLISYMSYDYDGEETFAYHFHWWTHHWYRLTMPFFPTEPGATTLHDLFPGADYCNYTLDGINWVADGIGIPFPAPSTVPLTGETGDALRTYTFAIHIPNGQPLYYEITGIPIVEQRYLDYESNDDLWFGSVFCDCGTPDLDFHDPDDYVDGKITSAHTDYYPEADYVIGPIHGTTSITNRYGYDTYPDESLPLPYHLDLRCKPLKDGKLADGTPPEHIVIVSPEEIDAEFGPSSIEPAPDSAAVREYLAQLRINETMGADPTTGPHLENIDIDLHKEIGSSSSPSSFELSVSPSPFNSTCEIKVNIPMDTYLTISIYDITGDIINTLISSEQSAGTRSYRWNGTDSNKNPVPSGIYFVVTKYNGQTIQKKVVYMK